MNSQQISNMTEYMANNKVMYRLLKIILILLLYVVLFVLFNNLVFANFYTTLKRLENLSYSTEILDHHSERLRWYTTKEGYWRLPIQITNVDSRFIQFLIACEDRRFYKHSGVDWLALFRAFTQALTSARIVSGGSTITMQTVRLIQPKPRTLINKFIEICHAFWLEQHLTKEQILSLYLTLAPYGGNIQGLRAASWFYFGKEPNFFTLAESALLIALPQAPEARRPDRAHIRARIARAKILHRLVTAGFIKLSEAKQAITDPIPRKRQTTPRLAPHFTDRVRVANPNLQQIFTTLNAKLQYQIEKMLVQYQEQQIPAVTIAIMVVENRTYAVRAYAGSANYFAKQVLGQQDMVRALRSPGSTLKPLVYGLAFEAGVAHPETLIFDRPETISGYAPSNFDRRYYGEITIREALRTSRNIPAIKVLKRLGINVVLQRLASVGINLVLPQGVTRSGLPIVLGGAGLRLEDLAKLYVGLANGGIIKTLRILETVPTIVLSPTLSSQSIFTLSSTLSSQSIFTLSPTLSFKFKSILPSKLIFQLPLIMSELSEKRMLLSSVASWYITDILAATQPPSGFSLRRHQLAFKTGTSYGLRDAWAIGYNATHTVVVWLGRPDNGYTATLSGLQSAVPIMLQIFDLLPKSTLAPLLRNPPSDAVLSSNAALPVNLQHFDDSYRIMPITKDSSKLKILYPPAHAVVELRSGIVPLVQVEISGGIAPFFILINGRPIGRSSDRRSLNWQPSSDGIVQLAILDGNGDSDRVQIRIHKVN